MDFGHSKACEGLALWAGRECGLAEPITLAQVAENADAKEVRDAAWGDYRRRLADTTTYSGEAILAWLAEHGVQISQASLSRDRAPVKAREDRLGLSSEITRRFLAQAGSADAGDVFKAGLARVGQVLFETSLQFDAQELRDAMEGGDFIRLAEAVGKLAKAHAETNILSVRLEEIQRKLTEAKVAADKRATATLESKGVDAKTIDQIRQIYGLPPLAEVAGDA
jgi:hypothetical protein